MRTIWLSILLSVVILVSCEPNFDILKDTDQRTVGVHLLTDEVLSNILEVADGRYVKTTLTEPGEGQCLRITGYCYDSQGMLRAQQTVLSSDLSPQTLHFKHLKRDYEYEVVFMADVVRLDEHVDYYEQWYQMGTMYWSTFYLVNNEHLTNSHLTALYSARTTLYPANQIDTLSLAPLTQNGFISFFNYNETKDTQVRVYICDKYYLKTGESELSYGYDYTLTKDKTVIPLTNIDGKRLSLYFFRQLTARTCDTLHLSLYPPRQPFVVNIDMNHFSSDDVEIRTY